MVNHDEFLLKSLREILHDEVNVNGRRGVSPSMDFVKLVVRIEQ